MTIKTIIHPTDFSEAAMPALHFAAQIARHCEAELHLVHVYEHPYVNAYYEGAMAALIDRSVDEEVKEALEQKMQELKNDPALEGLHPHAHLVADRPVWRFYEDENLPAADLTVLGTTGHTGLLHGGLLGTNAARTIRYAPMPVLSVPLGADTSRLPRKMLFATDHTEESQHAFGQAADFARLIGTEVQLATVATPVEFYASSYCLEEADKLIQKHATGGLSIDFELYNAYSIEAGIKELVRRHAADMTAMYTEGRSGIRSFFSPKSQAEELSKHLKIPELAIKWNDIAK